MLLHIFNFGNNTHPLSENINRDPSDQFYTSSWSYGTPLHTSSSHLPQEVSKFHYSTKETAWLNIDIFYEAASELLLEPDLSVMFSEQTELAVSFPGINPYCILSISTNLRIRQSRIFLYNLKDALGILFPFRNLGFPFLLKIGTQILIHQATYSLAKYRIWLSKALDRIHHQPSAFPRQP